MRRRVGSLTLATVPGAEILPVPSDTSLAEANVAHTARGASDEPTMNLGSFEWTGGEPLLMPVDMTMVATPSP